MEELYTLVIYDVRDDKARRRVIETCRGFGLSRFQYSGYDGMLDQDKRAELALQLREALGDDAGKVSIIPVCEKDRSMRIDILK
jgi:CRISPR-associated protein Cas2